MIRGALLALLFAAPAAAQDPVEQVRQDDPAMVAAIEGAQATLAYFFQRAGDQDVLDPAIKVAVPYEAGEDAREHIWMNDCGPSPDADLACIVANEPITKLVERGGVHHLYVDEISDWMYFDEQGLIHGGYTLRALLPRLPADQAAGYRDRLAPLPEPPER